MSTTQPAAAPGWYADPHHPGMKRYWDGTTWTEHRRPNAAPVVLVQAPGNGAAIAALVLGICGFFLMGIPFFIGLFIGGPLDLLAIIFGIIGFVKSQQVGRGLAPALIAMILAVISIITAFFGAGTIW
jgi:hypothetical protein